MSTDAASGVAIFRADVPSTPAAVEALASTLTEAEQRWAERLSAGGPRERFVAGRAAVRRLLGERLGVPPGEVPLRSGAGGKPELDTAGAPPLHFSVSHSGTMVLVAIAPGPVGVDLEGPRQLRHALEVAARTFARSELELLVRLPSGARPRRFLEIWTAKEAVLKASGEGLPGLSGVEVTPGSDGTLRTAGTGDARWAVRTFEPAPGYVAAVAAESLPDALEILSARA
jgi:4'-phosphopantetheinyl transferase